MNYCNHLTFQFTPTDNPERDAAQLAEYLRFVLSPKAIRLLQVRLKAQRGKRTWRKEDEHIAEDLAETLFPVRLLEL